MGRRVFTIVPPCTKGSAGSPADSGNKEMPRRKNKKVENKKLTQKEKSVMGNQRKPLGALQSRTG